MCRKYMRFDILTAMKTWIVVFEIMTPCRSVSEAPVASIRAGELWDRGLERLECIRSSPV
jgi:hypothetical protein